VTFRLGTGKTITFFTLYLYLSEPFLRDRNFSDGRKSNPGLALQAGALTTELRRTKFIVDLLVYVDLLFCSDIQLWVFYTDLFLYCTVVKIVPCSSGRRHLMHSLRTVIIRIFFILSLDFIPF
jgi:hypothetical protein